MIFSIFHFLLPSIVVSQFKTNYNCTFFLDSTANFRNFIRIAFKEENATLAPNIKVAKLHKRFHFPQQICHLCKILIQLEFFFQVRGQNTQCWKIAQKLSHRKKYDFCISTKIKTFLSARSSCLRFYIFVFSCSCCSWFSKIIDFQNS